MTRFLKHRLLAGALLAFIGALASPLVLDRPSPGPTTRGEFDIPALPTRLTALPFAIIEPQKSITPLTDNLPAEIISPPLVP